MGVIFQGRGNLLSTFIREIPDFQRGLVSFVDFSDCVLASSDTGMVYDHGTGLYGRDTNDSATPHEIEIGPYGQCAQTGQFTDFFRYPDSQAINNLFQADFTISVFAQATSTGQKRKFYYSGGKAADYWFGIGTNGAGRLEFTVDDGTDKRYNTSSRSAIDTSPGLFSGRRIEGEYQCLWDGVHDSSSTTTVAADFSLAGGSGNLCGVGKNNWSSQGVKANYYMTCMHSRPMTEHELATMADIMYNRQRYDVVQEIPFAFSVPAATVNVDATVVTVETTNHAPTITVDFNPPVVSVEATTLVVDVDLNYNTPSPLTAAGCGIDATVLDPTQTTAVTMSAVTTDATVLAPTTSVSTVGIQPVPTLVDAAKAHTFSYTYDVPNVVAVDLTIPTQAMTIPVAATLVTTETTVHAVTLATALEMVTSSLDVATFDPAQTTAVTMSLVASEASIHAPTVNVDVEVVPEVVSVLTSLYGPALALESTQALTALECTIPVPAILTTPIVDVVTVGATMLAVTDTDLEYKPGILALYPVTLASSQALDFNPTPVAVETTIHAPTPQVGGELITIAVDVATLDPAQSLDFNAPLTTVETTVFEVSTAVVVDCPVVTSETFIYDQYPSVEFTTPSLAIDVVIFDPAVDVGGSLVVVPIDITTHAVTTSLAYDSTTVQLYPVTLAQTPLVTTKPLTLVTTETSVHPVTLSYATSLEEVRVLAEVYEVSFGGGVVLETSAVDVSVPAPTPVVAPIANPVITVDTTVHAASASLAEEQAVVSVLTGVYPPVLSLDFTNAVTSVELDAPATSYVVGSYQTTVSVDVSVLAPSMTVASPTQPVLALDVTTFACTPSLNFSTARRCRADVRVKNPALSLDFNATLQTVIATVIDYPIWIEQTTVALDVAVLDPSTDLNKNTQAPITVSVTTHDPALGIEFTSTVQAVETTVPAVDVDLSEELSVVATTVATFAPSTGVSTNLVPTAVETSIHEPIAFAGYPSQTAAVTAIVTTTSGDKFRVRMQRVNGTSTSITVPSGSGMTILKLE